MKHKLKHKLTKLIPPGANLRSELKEVCAALCIQAALSLGFLFRYYDAVDSLYIYSFGMRMLITDAVIENVGNLLEHCLIGFWVVVGFCVILTAAHYMSFYRETKSIYLMKRLPETIELHKRCLTLPVLGILAGIILSVLLVCIYVLIYYIATPSQCLPGHISINLWRIIL
ncbi:MAG: hypothetical protein HUJ66_03805 [Oscillospiraceae bacterium]|nr:hypothetical protein [Oscillospiraceae bacterium]